MCLYATSLRKSKDYWLCSEESACYLVFRIHKPDDYWSLISEQKIKN